MIYLFDDVESITIQHLNQAYPFLSEERINKIQQLRFAKDKKLSAMTELLLQYAIEKNYGNHVNLEIVKTSSGKPYFKEKQGIYFNLSHCQEGIACAISDKPIGVDIQNIVEYNEDMLKMVCTDEEMEEIQMETDMNQGFTRFWCMKEAYLKCNGEGISDRINKYNFANCKDHQFVKYGYTFKVFTFNKYILAVCGEFHDIQIQKVDLNAFGFEES